MVMELKRLIAHSLFNTSPGAPRLQNRLNAEANGLLSTRSDASTRRESDDEDGETLTFAETAAEALALAPLVG